jgi:hypothetical protein
MQKVRMLLVAGGLALAVWGAVLLTRERVDQLAQVLGWAVGAVILHDGVLAGTTLALGWAALGLLRPRAAAIAARFLVVGGTLTLVALPALVHAATAGKNPTLLDRNYLSGWLALLVVVLIAAALTGPLADRITRRNDGPGHGRG